MEVDRQPHLLGLRPEAVPVPVGQRGQPEVLHATREHHAPVPARGRALHLDHRRVEVPERHREQRHVPGGRGVLPVDEEVVVGAHALEHELRVGVHADVLVHLEHADVRVEHLRGDAELVHVREPPDGVVVAVVGVGDAVRVIGRELVPPRATGEPGRVDLLVAEVPELFLASRRPSARAGRGSPTSSPTRGTSTGRQARSRACRRR